MGKTRTNREVIFSLKENGNRRELRGNARW